MVSGAAVRQSSSQITFTKIASFAVVFSITHVLEKNTFLNRRDATAETRADHKNDFCDYQKYILVDFENLRGLRLQWLPRFLHKIWRQDGPGTTISTRVILHMFPNHFSYGFVAPRITPAVVCS